MYEYDPDVEEIDDEPFEGKPDFDESPTTRTNDYGHQDDGDELFEPDTPTEEGDPNA